MIRKLKRKYLLLATSMTFVLMTLLVSIMNIINYSVVLKGCDMTLDVIVSRNIQNRPENEETKSRNSGNGMSPEAIHEARFFIVTLDKDNTILSTDFSRILTVDETTVNEFVDKAINKSAERGFVNDFRYLKIKKRKRNEAVFSGLRKKTALLSHFCND